MVELSYQLYSSRKKPLDETLTMLADLGYTLVEGYGALFEGQEDPAALRDQLEAAGLRMPTAHMPLEKVEGDPLGTAALARSLGIETIVVPFLPVGQRPTDAEGWQTFGRRLALTGKQIQSEGIGLAYHNHDFEFQPMDDAELPIDMILSGGQDLMFEIDAAWVQRAGEDPVGWIEKYGDRIVAAHIKDIAPEGEATDEGGWADPGHGIMDWPAIANALRASACRYFVMEHDDPGDDARFARRALETGRSL